jgi:hypothetical protein
VKIFEAFRDELLKLARGGDISPGYELGGRTFTLVDTPRSEDRFPPSKPRFSREILTTRHKIANSVVNG